MAFWTRASKPASLAEGPGGGDVSDEADVDHHPKVGVIGAAMIVVGTTVGSAVYLLPASLGLIGSISMIGWGLATLAAFAIAGVFVGLAPRAPQARGLPGYVEAGLGRFWGVQTSVYYWVGTWVSLVAVALAAAGATAFLFPAAAEPGPRMIVTQAVIWLAIGVAWMGSRAVAKAQAMTLILGLAPVILTATVGWLWFHPDVFRQSWNPGDLAPLQAIQGSALGAFWAFVGLEAAAGTAGVVRDPKRNVPRATILGVGAAAALYLSSNAAIMGILPAADLAASTAPFADATRAVLGVGLGALVAGCVLVRCIGCLCSVALITVETGRTAADDGAFPAVFRSRPGEVRSVFGLLAAGGCASALALATVDPDLARQYATVSNVVALMSLYCYGLAAVSLLALMRAGRAPRAGMALIALVAIGAAIALIASGKPAEIGLSLIAVAAGGILHLWLRSRPSAAATPP